MPLTQVRCCSMLPVFGSKRSSAPWLLTVQMPPLLEGWCPARRHCAASAGRPPAATAPRTATSAATGATGRHSCWPTRCPRDPRRHLSSSGAPGHVPPRCTGARPGTGHRPPGRGRCGCPASARPARRAASCPAPARLRAASRTVPRNATIGTAHHGTGHRADPKAAIGFGRQAIDQQAGNAGPDAQSPCRSSARRHAWCRSTGCRQPGWPGTAPMPPAAARVVRSGRKRCNRSWLSRRYRPPSWVPNQTEPSGVVARLQTVLVPINGWLLRS